MSDQPHLLFERDGHVATLTMNRPEAKNALSSEMLARMYDGWVEVDENPDIRVCILTGAGGTFCAGMDLKAFVTGERPWVGDRGFAGIVQRASEKPLIAAIEGFGVAGGLEIALACDLRYTTDAAPFRIGQGEMLVGVIPGGGGSQRLLRILGTARALEHILEGVPPPRPRRSPSELCMESCQISGSSPRPRQPARGWRAGHRSRSRRSSDASISGWTAASAARSTSKSPGSSRQDLRPPRPVPCRRTSRI